MNAETIVQVAIPLILGIIMFTMGMGLTIADFQRVFEKPRAVAMGSIAQLVVLPLFAFIVGWVFTLRPEIAIGLVLVACCPGGPSSNLMSNLARGDTALSVTLTAVSGVVTILTIPFIVNFALSQFAGESTPKELPVLRTNLQILLVVGVPLVLGMVVRAKNVALAARSERKLKTISVLLLLILIVGAVAKETSRIADFLAEAGLVVVGFNLVTMMVGFLLARIARLPRPQSVTITLEVGMQNAAMAIGIALGILHDSSIAIPGVIYGLWMYATCGAVVFLARRWVAQVESRAESL